MDDTKCPICYEDICEDDNVLCMPICLHKIHTKCGLKAAQYDTRCPICRTKDPDITTRQDDDVVMYANLERLAREHDRCIRNYNQKRTRVIKKNSKLGRIRDKLKIERNNYLQKEKELEKHWTKIQKETWKTDPEISRLKKERLKCQRKSNLLCRRLEKEIEQEVGPKPDDIMFNMNIE
tara:strand:- start:2726 stop:3262 length:537 start_codon:yes stop_codon:yes gene_type:complete